MNNIQRVAAGIAFLNSKRCDCGNDTCNLGKVWSQWAENIDLSDLDLGSTTRCMLGQIGERQGKGSYWDMQSYLGLDDDDCVRYGFTSNGNDYEGLTAEWKKQLNELLGNVAVEVGKVYVSNRWPTTEAARVIAEITDNDTHYVVVRFGTPQGAGIKDEASYVNIITRSAFTGSYREPEAFEPKAGSFAQGSDGVVYFMDASERLWKVVSDRFSTYTTLGQLSSDGVTLEPYLTRSGKPLTEGITLGL